MQVLLERERELAAIDERIAAARSGGGSLLLVEATAGLGKTRLLQAVRDGARQGGMQVLTARGSELERDFQFALVRQLFEPPVAGADAATREGLLEGAAAFAAPVLGLETRSRDGESERATVGVDASFAALHGLYWLVFNLAESAPLLLAVDDAHWADASSLRFLKFLLPRLEELPVLLAVAARPAEPGAHPTLVAELTSDPAAGVLRPGPLSRPAVAVLVRDSLSADAADEFCDACQDATGGNPFMLRELLAELAAAGVPPTAAQSPRVREVAPATISRALLLRLARLPEAAAALARAVAVLGEGAALRQAAALAGLEGVTAAEAADALAGAGVLERGRPLRFVHPLIRNAIYSDLASAKKAAAHAEAARLLASEGAGPDRVAVHLLATEAEGDTGTVEALRAAAKSALERGAPEGAVTYLRRALEEPPRGDARPDLLLELGTAESRMYDFASIEHLTAAFEQGDDPTVKVSAARLLGQALLTSGRMSEVFEVLDQAIALAAASDPELALEVEAELLASGQIMYALTPVTIAERVGRHGDIEGRTPGERKLLAVKAFEAARADAAAGGRLARRALAEGDILTEHPTDSPLFYSLAFALIYADLLDLADRVFEEALADARARGSIFGFAAVSCMRSYVAYLRGGLPDAEAEARNAIDAQGVQAGVLLPRAVACLIDPLVERGELDAAGEALAGIGAESGPLDAIYHGWLVASRGRLRVARGQLKEGVEDFLAYGAAGERFSYGTGITFPWRSSAALALLVSGEREEARRLAREELELYRDSGIARGLGVALRALGLVEGGEKGIELLRRAVDALEGSSARLEHARALADLGAALRRANRRAEAREPLRAALDLAHRCGATALMDRARRELAATGAKPRKLVFTGVDSLTASERRIAEMAAAGRRNRDIAQALFVTVKTVETHLFHAYQKLDITSRQDLPRALSGAAAEAPGSHDQPSRRRS